jgi:hypothetical protein
MNRPRFEVYPRTKLAAGEVEEGGEREPDGFGWRFRGANGRIQAVGGEGFTRRADAHRAVDDFCDELESVSSGTDAGAYIGRPIVDLEADES